MHWVGRGHRGEALVATCRLCLSDTELLNSHVLPAFVWRTLKRDDAGQYLYLQFDKNRCPEVAKKQQEEYRERLLCRPCEDRINRFERPIGDLANAWFAAGILGPEGGLSTQACRAVNVSALRSLVYATFWRMSVSSVSYFRDFTLPADVEEDLRLQTLTGVLGDPMAYPIMAYLERSLMMKEYFSYPSLGPDELGNVFVQFICMGFSWRMFTELGDFRPLEGAELGRSERFSYGVFDFEDYPPSSAYFEAMESDEVRRKLKLPPDAPEELPSDRILRMSGMPLKPTAFKGLSVAGPLGAPCVVLVALYENVLTPHTSPVPLVCIKEPYLRAKMVSVEAAKERFAGQLDDW